MIAVSGAYKYVVTPRGTVYRIPKDWVSRTADNGKGIIFQDPHSVGRGNGDENSIRIAEPDGRYPDGYFRAYNKTGQPVDIAGKPGKDPVTHFDETGEEDPIVILDI